MEEMYILVGSNVMKRSLSPDDGEGLACGLSISPDPVEVGRLED